MPITRTAIQDDDGSGKTGTVIDNAWKQEFYDQIDAILAPNTLNAFTAPVLDRSGANLGTLGTLYGLAIGKMVLLQGQLNYPANSNGLAALIGYLPFNCHATAPGGLYLTLGLASGFFIGANQNFIQVKNPSSGAARTNAELSGAVLALAGVYYTV